MNLNSQKAANSLVIFLSNLFSEVGGDMSHILVGPDNIGPVG